MEFSRVFDFCGTWPAALADIGRETESIPTESCFADQHLICYRLKFNILR